MRDWNAPGNLVGFITRINRIRREHRALQLYRNLAFHPPTIRTSSGTAR